jgi:AcrR family transcriptional regulator
MVSSPKKKIPVSERLGPEAWVQAARSLLMQSGIAAVKVEPLAARLGVTTGSFYWHFKDRRALQAAMLMDWEATNSSGFYSLITDHPGDGAAQFDALVNLWLDERAYSSSWDSAVRDWARTDPDAESAVRRVDQKRIDILHTIFINLRFAEPEALVRARVTYFHQVGYYAMKIAESLADRLALAPIYLKVLAGRSA